MHFWLIAWVTGCSQLMSVYFLTLFSAKTFNFRNFSNGTPCMEFINCKIQLFFTQLMFFTLKKDTWPQEKRNTGKVILEISCLHNFLLPIVICNIKEKRMHFKSCSWWCTFIKIKTGYLFLHEIWQFQFYGSVVQFSKIENYLVAQCVAELLIANIVSMKI